MSCGVGCRSMSHARSPLPSRRKSTSRSAGVIDDGLIATTRRLFPFHLTVKIKFARKWSVNRFCLVLHCLFLFHHFIRHPPRYSLYCVSLSSRLANDLFGVNNCCRVASRTSPELQNSLLRGFHKMFHLRHAKNVLAIYQRLARVVQFTT